MQQTHTQSQGLGGEELREGLVARATPRAIIVSNAILRKLNRLILPGAIVRWSSDFQTGIRSAIRTSVLDLAGGQFEFMAKDISGGSAHAITRAVLYSPSPTSMWHVLHLIARPIETLLGLFCVLTAILLYPNQEGIIQSKLEDFWVRADDYKSLALSRHAAFMTQVAGIVELTPSDRAGTGTAGIS
jgi:hypothetical protein